MASQTFGQQLRTLREHYGFTQQQVADILKLDRSTYSYYETGRSYPQFHTLQKIARIYNVEPSTLLNFELQPLTVGERKRRPDPSEKFGNNSSYIYHLSTRERQLVALFRLAPEKMQEGLLQYLMAQTHEGAQPHDAGDSPQDAPAAKPAHSHK